MCGLSCICCCEFCSKTVLSACCNLNANCVVHVQLCLAIGFGVAGDVLNYSYGQILVRNGCVWLSGCLVALCVCCVHVLLFYCLACMYT